MVKKCFLVFVMIVWSLQAGAANTGAVKAGAAKKGAAKAGAAPKRAVKAEVVETQAVRAGEENRWTGNINGKLGVKYFDEHWTDEGGAQFEAGADIDLRKKTWPVNIVLGVSWASTFGPIADFTTTELKLGVRKIWEPTRSMRPFIGGGLNFVNAEIETDLDLRMSFADLSVHESESDNGVGAWVGAGVYWTLGNVINLGFEAGYSNTEVTLAGRDANAGGTHGALLLGYHW